MSRTRWRRRSRAGEVKVQLEGVLKLIYTKEVQNLEEEHEIEAVLKPIYTKEVRQAIIKEIKPIVKQDVQPIIKKEVIHII